ncbi:MAG TPA: DUF2231 domain-containing protein [Syntrophales bacterium]|nr:DUF2231 domain-containing protein [Syntrophales bacterium]
MIEKLFPGIAHLQNIHPLVVHFPIAFLFGCVLFYVLALLARKELLAFTAFFLLLLGTVGAAAAVGTGIYAEPGVLLSPSVRGHLLARHEDFMLSTLCVSLILAVWAAIARPFPKRGRILFILLLFVLLGIMSVGADYGARMVYDYNAGGNACPQPIEFFR